MGKNEGDFTGHPRFFYVPGTVLLTIAIFHCIGNKRNVLEKKALKDMVA